MSDRDDTDRMTAATTPLPDWLAAPADGAATAEGDAPAPPPPAPAPAPEPAPAVASAPEQPTIRWGALVWALLFGAVGAITLWALVDPERRAAVGEWMTALDPLAAVLYVFIALGVVVALFGIVGLIRRGERVRRDRVS